MRYYNAQGYMIEEFTDVAETCGPRFNNKICNPGKFCMNGTCVTAGDKTLYSTTSEETNNDCRTFSGEGTEGCDFKEKSSIGCGPMNGYAQCEDNMFCNMSGQCGYGLTNADGSEDCKVYSGNGIKNCDYEISENGKCGPLGGYKRCGPRQYCSDEGMCVKDLNQVGVAGDNCRDYSGKGIVDCKPVISVNGKCGPNFDYQVCQSNMFCNDFGVCEPKSKTSSYNNNCMEYSGAGTSNCEYIQVSKTVCGATSGTKCDRLMYCNDNGVCSMVQPNKVTDNNCYLHSGKGVKNCDINISTNGQCGVNGAICPPYQFCADNGRCVGVRGNHTRYCNEFSGAGVVNCSLPTHMANYTVFPNTNINTSRLLRTESRVIGKQALEDCVVECNKDSRCSGVSVANNSCTLFTAPRAKALANRLNAQGAYFAHK